MHFSAGLITIVSILPEFVADNVMDLNARIKIESAHNQRFSQEYEHETILFPYDHGTRIETSYDPTQSTRTETA